MGDDDYFCRRVWMEVYVAALESKRGTTGERKSDRNPDSATVPCPNGHLVVRVTDYDNKPVSDAVVSVERLGSRNTDADGVADYGEVCGGNYAITAEKKDHRPAAGQPVGPAKVSASVPANETTRVPLQLDPPTIIHRENLMIIGSEMEYDSFWLKMMFIAAGYLEASKAQKFRAADAKTIAYVDVGYTRFEKLTLDYLRDNGGYRVIKLGSSSDIVRHMNERERKVDGKKKRFLLQDVAFFSHGLPGTIKLNYNSSPDINFTASELGSIKADVFVPDGRIYSYACRTGVSRWSESFSSDEDAKPGDSLAQKMADHFRVEVHAFLRRSFYGEVLREKRDSDTIAATLKQARETEEGKVIEIPPEHQGLPHPGLADGLFSGAKKEGTNSYSLWRKAGGIRLPGAGETPKGLSAGMRVFKSK